MVELATIYDHAKYYVKHGFSVIPLKPRSKEPLVAWKQYQERLPSPNELEEWFKGRRANIAVVTGRVSGNLVVLDFDSKDSFKAFAEKLKSASELLRYAINNTWIVETGKGYHVYLRLPREDLVPSTKVRLVEGVDLKAEGGYVVAPPSVHPSGKQYSFIEVDGELLGPPNIPEPIELREEEWQELLKLLAPPEKQVQRTIGPTRTLTEEQIRTIVKLIEPYYVQNHRDLIVFSLLGSLIKAKVDYNSARRIIELLTASTNDEEADKRLYLVDYHYGKRVENLSIERLRGVSGLREEFEKVLREKGLPEDEIVRNVSETIAELYSILGLNRGPGVAWLERKGGFIKKWVAVGRQGIYLFKRGNNDDEPIVQIVSNARIRKAKAIRVLGLDLRNLYAVDIEGEIVSGTIDEIVSYIEKHYGLERGAKYAVARLIEYTSEEEEELFYSPGPWVVNGKIVFAREPGYTPQWKHYVIWNPPSEDISEERKRNALESLKRLVLAYRDPSKPSLVLSYAAISPIMHYVKRILNIAPHMIIHGLEGSGKSVLLETVKLLFNITWDEVYPGSDFQARKMLATSTLPAVIDEINDLIKGYINNKKDALDAMGVLHRAATQEILRISGGHTYGGYYLAIRTIIAGTNEDISLVPWQLDKFILVTISLREGIDLERAMGYTPRTMSPEVKEALPYIGVELLKEIENLLPEVNELRRYSRVEIREKLIELGYKAWKRLYMKYGLDPFPIPAKPETEIEKTSIKEQYEDIFLSYIARCEKAEKGFPFLVTFQNEDDNIKDNVEALNALNENLAIIVRKRDEQGQAIEELICKPAFLTRFKEWAAREFGLTPLGWKRLAELLGMQRTRRIIGGKTLNNLLVKRLS